jgi:hypothetical protein
MDSHALRLFLSLAENLHFGKTSREQHVSPSALSRSTNNSRMNSAHRCFYATTAQSA